MNPIKKAWRFLFVSDPAEKRCGFFRMHSYVEKDEILMDETGEYIGKEPILVKKVLHTQTCSICGDFTFDISKY